jgi:hypothetical protein
MVRRVPGTAGSTAGITVVVQAVGNRQTVTVTVMTFIQSYCQTPLTSNTTRLREKE